MQHVELQSHAKTAVANAYTALGRGYHGIHHLAFLWHCHKTLEGRQAVGLRAWLPEDHTKIATTIAAHDFIYDPQSTTNEINSAAWYMANAVHDGTPGVVPFTHLAILASADHFATRTVETSDDLLREWFLGLDLIPLAAPYDVFDAHTHLIRAEYHHLSDQEWNDGRLKFLRKAAGATPIFAHPVLESLFGATAKANIERSINELKSSP